ncbi:transmembrane and coiled-coil domains protein 2-like isoform X3 [Biomphalaria glabrata]|uniref:Transmembrane and coiled-coil domains protein 2-like isoform X3 n=1 Tax=Biomphalaria glabrata TaxID=6526 RepID=A0A9W2ZAN6_BIOGL|nr:transmembrane and coiled-coil domains protein 2-like isoform X3 [Biomphalaria glabrata]
MFKLNPFVKGKSKSAEDIQIIIHLAEDEIKDDRLPTIPMKSCQSPPRKSLQENGSFLKTGYHADSSPRRKSFDIAADRRPSVINSFISRITLPAMKRSDQKTTASKGLSKVTARASPLMGKKSILAQETSAGSTVSGLTVSSGSQYEESTLTSSDDMGVDNGSDPGVDEVDGVENSARTKQAVETLQAKIQKTKDAIRKEQNTKEAIVNEYLQMASDKQPTARIKALFEKKNQKSAMNINQLQKKLENYQHRLVEIETHGYTGHKQAKEVLRDVGQGLNTIVSKPKEFAHLIKNKFGSADNINQLSKFYVELEETSGAEASMDGKSGGTLPASFKYTSDDETSSITSGSGLNATHSSPHHAQQQPSLVSAKLLEPLTEEMNQVRETSRKVNDILLRLAEEFEDYKKTMDNEVEKLRSQLEEEKFKVERLEEQLNDLTDLHQNEVINLKQDLTSMEEKIEYRLDERTTDLSDLVDNASTRISRLEQVQQQQQILSMEMVENATFRTIISKLINVVLAILAVILVLVSTAASFLSPFLNSTPRLVLSVLATITAWLVYQHYSSLQTMTFSLWTFFSWPWS